MTKCWVKNTLILSVAATINNNFTIFEATKNGLKKKFGSGIGKNQYTGSGINITDPQHYGLEV
jgi:hypothetical protein